MTITVSYHTSASIKEVTDYKTLAEKLYDIPVFADFLENFYPLDPQHCFDDFDPEDDLTVHLGTIYRVFPDGSHPGTWMVMVYQNNLPFPAYNYAVADYVRFPSRDDAVHAVKAGEITETTRSPAI